MNHYIKCKVCGKPMHGLRGMNKRQTRNTCQPCGGNKTEYNADNLHPEARGYAR